MKTDKLRAVALIGVVLLLIAVGTVLLMPPADGYEISIYDAFPVYFWVSVIGSLTAGALVSIGSARVSEDDTWRYGFSLMLLSSVLLVLLPYLRGYRMYGRADNLTHLGYIRDIISTAGVGGNLYPPLHLLGLAVAEATGADLPTVGLLLPPVLSILFLISMYDLLGRVAGSRREFLLMLPVAVLPLLGAAHISFRPFDASLLMLPFVFTLWIRSQRRPAVATRLPFVVGLVALVLYHPLTGIFFIGIAGLYVTAGHLSRFRSQASYTNVASLSVAVFLGWYSGETGLIIRVESVFETLFGTRSSEAPVDSYQRTISESSPELIDILRVAVFRYGLEMLLFGLSFLFVVVLVSRFLEDQNVPDLYIVTLTGTFIGSSLGGLAFLFSALFVAQDRPWQVAKICAIPLTGRLFYYFWQYRDRSREFRIGTDALTVAAVTMIVVIAVLGFYPSPAQSATNLQVTSAEMEGTDWTTNYGNTERTLQQFGLSHRRFHQASAGRRADKPFVGTTPPAHFNYTVHEHLGQSYTNDTYLVLTRLGRVTYPKRFEGYRAQWRYTPAEFARLERDSTVDRIYDNGGYTQYTVEGSRRSPGS